MRCFEVSEVLRLFCQGHALHHIRTQWPAVAWPVSNAACNELKCVMHNQLGATGQHQPASCSLPQMPRQTLVMVICTSPWKQRVTMGDEG